MEALIKNGLRLWRGLAGDDTRLERLLRSQYRTVKSKVEREITGENYVLFWSRSGRAKRVGLYLKGSCHLRAVFSCKASIQRVLEGSCCILNDGDISDSRSDILLQTVRNHPWEWITPLLGNLRISEEYFRPRILEPTFSIPGLGRQEEFGKTVVFLSVAADAVRTAYRHCQHGILLDPGGWWLSQPMEQVLGSLEAVNWFRKNFESIGRIGVDVFAQNYAQIIDLVRKHTGAYVIVFSIPTVEPGKLIHNYQFVRDPLSRRTREFNVALAELSRRLDFPIVDVDRVLKRAGVGRQLDFAHFSPEQFHTLGQEAFSIMSDLGLFSKP